MLEFPVTVAYNMRDKMVGCVLVQAGMGATIPTSELSFHFDDKYWEMNPSKCKLYEVRSQTEFDFMITVTKDWYENKRIIAQHQSGRDQSQDPGG